MPPFVDSYYFEALLWFCTTALLLRWSFLGYKALQAQRKSQRSLVDRINAQLPQTQCGQCGHAGCMPYARAISAGEAINKCPPGGPVTIRRLARVLNQPIEGVDPAHGIVKTREVAVIREAECIGCTKCIVACPVDAILGAAKLMHTVLSSECTGCDLCVAPCPVDCIDMLAITAPAKQWLAPDLDTDAALISQQESVPC